MYRVVKLGSPNLNYLIIVGSVLLYTCVYLYVYSVDSFDQADIYMQCKKILSKLIATPEINCYEKDDLL